MSDYSYTTIDGQRVEKRVAEAFEKLAAAFKKQFKLELLVTSGTRTRAEQQALYDKYIKGQGNQAAKPGTSRHEAENPIGPRALDLRDSGKDPGVKYPGTKRANWLRKNAPKYGFINTGYWFKQREAWHYEWQGDFDNSGQEASNSGGVKRAASALPNKYGLVKMEGLQKVANMYTKGKKTAIDNVWGDLSQRGFNDFLDKRYGDHLDKGLAAWLRDRWGYEGDNKYGPNMKAALERANAANDKAL